MNGKGALPNIITSVQGMRGVAALLVLLFHIAETQRQVMLDHGQTMNLANTHGIWDRGYAGVDMFFVISGFIMVYVTRTYAPSWRTSWRFFRSRLARIYPLWWIYASAMALYYVYTYHLPADPQRVVQSGGLVTYLVKSYLLLPTAALPVLGLGWTLIHEMFFYFVFAAFLLLPRKWLKWALGAWAMAVLVGAMFGIPQAYARNLPELAGSWLSLEFIFGAFAALLIVHFPVNKWHKPALWIGLAGFALGMVFVQPVTNTVLTWGRVLGFGAPCVLIIYGLTAQEISSGKGVPKHLRLLGDWSYSLYLSHFLVLSVIKRVFAKLAPHFSVFDVGHSGVLDNLAFAFTCVISALLIAALSYRFVERPFLRGARVLLRISR